MSRLCFVWIVAVASMTLACSLLNPEAGTPVPKNPGTVIVLVADQNGKPIAGVMVHITDIPNSVGTTYSVGAATDADGTVRLGSIPAGNRGVEVVVPSGYVPDQEGSVRRVDVVFNASVTVSFTLIRQ